MLMPYRPVDQGDGGKHRALLIGINYKGCGAGELKGCHNDVAQMREYITTHVRSRRLTVEEDLKPVLFCALSPCLAGRSFAELLFWGPAVLR